MGSKIKSKLSTNVFRVILILIICSVFYSLGFLIGRDGSQLGITTPSGVVNAEKGKNTSVDFSVFWKTWDTVTKNYVGQVDEKKMVEGAIAGMVESVGDPYTTYLSADENSMFKEDISGQFEGIGIEVALKDEKVTVVAPIDGSPAKKAGIEAGDVIVKVDGKSVESLSIDDVVKLIKGKSGTKVVVSVLKKGQGEAKDYTIVRDTIEVKSVHSEIKDGNIGYVKVRQFGDDTYDLYEKAIKDFKRKNVNGVVIDLRDNPGGLLKVAEDMVSLVMKSGVVVKTKDKSGKVVEEKTTKSAILTKPKMIVLVNEGSASASEIFAGAIQDSKRGKLVGMKTFGKGSVQELADLGDGSSIKVTIAKWLTPKGRVIDKKGIEPDIKVENKEENVDSQLERALSEVKK